MQGGSEEPVYVISVAARLAGLPCWVLRVLDQEGIVVPQRTGSNRRLYSDRDIALLSRVRYLTEERGVNIAGVKVILEMERQQSAASLSPFRETPPPASEPQQPHPTRRLEESRPIALPPYSKTADTKNGH